jgi:hypothetical protein
MYVTDDGFVSYSKIHLSAIINQANYSESFIQIIDLIRAPLEGLDISRWW